jgi:hypothetical protein
MSYMCRRNIRAVPEIRLETYDTGTPIWPNDQGVCSDHVRDSGRGRMMTAPHHTMSLFPPEQLDYIDGNSRSVSYWRAALVVVQEQ